MKERNSIVENMILCDNTDHNNPLYFDRIQRVCFDLGNSGDQLNLVK